MQNLVARMDFLEQKFHELEERFVNIHNSGVNLETLSAAAFEKIAHIESQIVNPPRSKGIMVNPDGSLTDLASNNSNDVIAAFENGAGNLLAKL